MSNELERMTKEMVIAKHTVRGCSGHEGKIIQSNAICTDNIPTQLFYYKNNKSIFHKLLHVSNRSGHHVHHPTNKNITSCIHIYHFMDRDIILQITLKSINFSEYFVLP